LKFGESSCGGMSLGGMSVGGPKPYLAFRYGRNPFEEISSLAGQAIIADDRKLCLAAK
jgi:hypothetical protein